MKISRSVALVLTALLLVHSQLFAYDLKPAEIISKHLDSVGPQDKRDSLKTLMAMGISDFESTNPVIKGGGKAIIVSDPENFFFVMSLNSKEYPFEKIGYFHGSVDIPVAGEGQRALLGNFVANHSKVLSDGLFGGLLSLRWPLLSAKPRGRLSGGGTKKIDGKNVYMLDYSESGGGSSEFTIKLYFDAETFRHVRTEYNYEVMPGDMVFGQQNRRAAGRLTLTETYSKFKQVEGLTLPFGYRVEYESNGNTGAYKTKWGIDIAQWSLNQRLAPDFFTFQTK